MLPHGPHCVKSRRSKKGYIYKKKIDRTVWPCPAGWAAKERVEPYEKKKKTGDKKLKYKDNNTHPYTPRPTKTQKKRPKGEIQPSMRYYDRYYCTLKRYH